MNMNGVCDVNIGVWVVVVFNDVVCGRNSD